MPYHFLLTIDVEDWFQVENFKQWIPFSSWSSCESRVEKNTHKLLDLLDSIKIENTESRMQQTEYKKSEYNATQGALPQAGQVAENDDRIFGRKQIGVSPLRPEAEKSSSRSGESSQSCLTTPKATFFVLGWTAERLPHLVREIHNRGHEVASHGSNHRLCNECSPEELRKDLSDSKKRLEDITGAPVYGYRAPSFSINDDSLKIIEDCGYLYDSSFNSFAINQRYGRPTLSDNDKNGLVYQVSDTFYEFPISNLQFKINHSSLNIVFPLGGGGYFRMMPFRFFKRGVQSILKKENNYLFYMHPWEIDPDQPRVNEASRINKFRHYVNLDKTQFRLSNLLESFSNCRFPTCNEYLQDVISHAGIEFQFGHPVPSAGATPVGYSTAHG